MPARHRTATYKAALSPTALSWLAGKRAKLWTTFNEPGVAAICGHIVGNHPPGKILHFRVSLSIALPCNLTKRPLVEYVFGNQRVGAFQASSGCTCL